MSDIQIRIPQNLAAQLLSHLSEYGIREPVAFGYVTHASTLARKLILVREIVIPPESAYLPSTGHGARWSGQYTIQLLNEAHDRSCGIFIFHRHGGNPVRMSSDDLKSASELLPRFQIIIPSRPHGSIVLGDECSAGTILQENHESATGRFSFRLFDQRMVTWPIYSSSRRERERFERQPLALGKLTRKSLSQSTVVVVGLSGGGSPACRQLAQLGVGEVVGIDDDSLEEGNRFSGMGFGLDDIRHKRPKAEVIAAAVNQIDPRVRFTSVIARLPEQESLPHIKRADVIIGCVNNLHARADIQEIALRYLIPYVDIGLSINTDHQAEEEFPGIKSILGNVFTYVPGGPCLWCTGFLSDTKLARETNSRGRSYFTGVNNADALVVSFNGVLASQAVSETLQLLTAFAPKGTSTTYKRYDGFSGTMTAVDVRSDPRCRACGTSLGAGDVVWDTTSVGLPR